MSKLLLAGDFQHLQPLLVELGGHRLLICHSLERLRGEWGRGDTQAVVLSLTSWTPHVFQLFTEGRRTRPEVLWIIVLREIPMLEETPTWDGVLVLSGQMQADWGPRARRWLADGEGRHRRDERRSCRGGVRIKDSEFGSDRRGVRIEGRLLNLGRQGVALHLPEMPYQPQEFVEVAFRDPAGVSRRFHGQVRWIKSGKDQGFEVGIQFMAAA